MTDGFAARTLDHIEVVRMPVKRAYDGTLSEFAGASNIDWTGLTIKLDYQGNDPDVEITYDGDDSRFTFSTVTFNGGDYNRPATPGNNLILNAEVTFTDTDSSSVSTQLNSHALSTNPSRYIFVANLPISTYFNGAATGSLMADVSAPASGYVDVNTNIFYSCFGDAATNPIANQLL